MFNVEILFILQKLVTTNAKTTMEKENKDFLTDKYYYDEDSFQSVQFFPKERTEKLAQQYKKILETLGEDTNREGLTKTPMRVAKAMQYLTQGYFLDAEKILESAKFHEDYQDVVIVKNIELYSLCEHHIIPFFGKAHVAYYPNGFVTGLSKIPRVVDAYARRLQIQERLTNQIHDTINKVLAPKGVAVVIEAYHLCMMMRGVQKQNSYTVTIASSGVFKSEPEKLSYFLDLIGIKS